MKQSYYNTQITKCKLFFEKAAKAYRRNGYQPVGSVNVYPSLANVMLEVGECVVRLIGLSAGMI